jgi:hypothetical protein
VCTPKLPRADTSPLPAHAVRATGTALASTCLLRWTTEPRRRPTGTRIILRMLCRRSEGAGESHARPAVREVASLAARQAASEQDVHWEGADGQTRTAPPSCSLPLPLVSACGPRAGGSKDGSKA